MAQIECLQLETGFESLVRQAVSHRAETNLRSSAFCSARVGKTWALSKPGDRCLYSFSNMTEHYFTTAPGDQRRPCCKNSPSKCCRFLASACSSSVHISISRTSNLGYANPQTLVVNYDNHCNGIFFCCPLSWPTETTLEKLSLKLKLAMFSLNAVAEVSGFFWGWGRNASKKIQQPGDLTSTPRFPYTCG